MECSDAHGSEGFEEYLDEVHFVACQTSLKMSLRSFESKLSFRTVLCEESHLVKI
jgi:hypothetical protein